MQEFTNGIVAGDVLIRPAIKSPNYVPGVSGWSINQTGSAEFTDVTVGGSTASSVLVRFSDGSYQKIYGGTFLLNGLNFPGTWLALNPPDVVGETWRPGAVGTGTGSNRSAYVSIASPSNAALGSDFQAQLQLWDRGTSSGAEIDLRAEKIFLDSTASGTGDKVIEAMGTLNARNDVNVTGTTVLLGQVAIWQDLFLEGPIRDIPSCGLTLAANYATSASWQTISYGAGTEQWDVGNLHDTLVNPSRITVPRTGIYELVHFAAFPNNTTLQRGSAFAINGSRVLAITPQPTSGFSTTPALTIRQSLTAGDVVEHQIFQNSGSTLNVTTYFQATYCQSV
jgi:hypothetical protein